MPLLYIFVLVWLFIILYALSLMNQAGYIHKFKVSLWEILQNRYESIEFCVNRVDCQYAQYKHISGALVLVFLE